MPPASLPEDWEVLHHALSGVRWAAREGVDPADPDRFRANLVLTVDDTATLTFREWQAGTDEILPRQLDDYLLVDLEKLEIDGGAAGRRLAHHAGPQGEAMTMEQWFLLADGLGFTLTATAETGRYDELADVWAGVAHAWRPVSGGDGHAG